MKHVGEFLSGQPSSAVTSGFEGNNFDKVKVRRLSKGCPKGQLFCSLISSIRRVIAANSLYLLWSKSLKTMNAVCLLDIFPYFLPGFNILHMAQFAILIPPCGLISHSPIQKVRPWGIACYDSAQGALLSSGQRSGAFVAVEIIDDLFLSRDLCLGLVGCLSLDPAEPNQKVVPNLNFSC